MTRIFLIIILIAVLSPTASGEPRSPHRFSITGPIRLGGFQITKSAKEKLETNVSYNGNKLENVIGKNLHLEYAFKAFGIGLRWLSYSLEGSNATLDQTLDLEYLLATVSVNFLESKLLHPDVISRFGITLGTGHNKYNLSTKTSEAIAVKTVDETFSSTGTANLAEIYFSSTLRSGWGYKLGYFAIETSHSTSRNGSPPDGSTGGSGYLAIFWHH